MKTPKSCMLGASVIQSIMSGALAAFASGDSVTLKYVDGTSERADCPAEAQTIRDYALWSESKGKYRDPKIPAPATPNFFYIVSAVQAKRPATLNADEA